MSQVVRMSWRQTAELSRPTNYARNAYHAANGVFVSWLVLHLVSDVGMVKVAASVAACAWLAEGSRRLWTPVNRLLMAIWSKTAHPHEATSINSGTWIVTGMFIIAVLYSKVLACVGVVVCGFGDPAAALIGRKFGRNHIRGGRTVEGSASFLVVSTLAVLVLLAIYAPDIPLLPAALIALCAGAAGMSAELWGRVDDNLSIPVAASTAGWLAMTALGYSPQPGWLWGLLN